MYKSRFTQWKLRKNMTAKAALDAIAQNPAEMLSLADNKAATKKRQEYFRRLPKEKQM